MIVELILAGGCFWGVEKNYDNFKGVIKAESGYVGGNYPSPTYRKVMKHKNDKGNYVESVKVTFDNEVIKPEKILKNFWELHDPTQKNRQGNDIGTNYRSAIFYTTEAQHVAAEETKKEYQDLLTKAGLGSIQTTIQPLKVFYKAENYHQDYLAKHPNGYCPNHATGVKFPHDASIEIKKPLMPIKGKEIIIIKSGGECPYCDKFEEEVTNKYKGSIKLSTVVKSRLMKYDIKTDAFATPTILFIEDGKEVFGHVGYMNSAEFYKALGAFKLGESTMAFNIAFNKGTEPAGCRQYHIFQSVKDGIFVDKLSGEKLFDTRDRFYSGTGWLSFFKSYGNNVIEKPDNSHGMRRTEILAKTSGIHLGHVFPMANGKRRFCLDATVLEFVPRAEIGKKN